MTSNDNGQAPKLVGYDVSNNVTVTVRKVDNLGALLDKLVQAGSNQINGISFDVSKPEAALDEARKLATADATRKAKLYAEAMGVELGNVMSISEGGGYQPPMPMRAQGHDEGRCRRPRAGGRGRADARGRREHHLGNQASGCALPARHGRDSLCPCRFSNAIRGGSSISRHVPCPEHVLIPTDDPGLLAALSRATAGSMTS